MAKDETGKRGTGTDDPPAFTFSVDDRRTGDELFPVEWAASAAKLYSDEFIASAAQVFEIEDELIELFKRFLGLAASYYFRNAGAPTEAQQQIALREELTAIANLLGPLIQRVKRPSALAHDRLWCPVWDDPGRPSRMTGLGDINGPNLYPDEKQLLDALELRYKRVLAQLVDLQSVKDPGGHPERMDIYAFVIVARDFWVKVLHRKFAYQIVGRIPKSEAFEFCKHLIRRLDASVTDQEIATAMRKIIAAANPTGRFVPS